ncbi:hypothetical protein IEE94_11435 [Yimella sp. cx-573]|nr:hypothetical protein [Yimella sp. cx-573]
MNAPSYDDLTRRVRDLEAQVARVRDLHRRRLDVEPCPTFTRGCEAPTCRRRADQHWWHDRDYYVCTHCMDDEATFTCWSCAGASVVLRITDPFHRVFVLVNSLLLTGCYFAGGRS